MRVGAIVPVSGCVTQEAVLWDRTLAEIENLMGFHAGRLAGGMTVIALLLLPEVSQFELASCVNLVTGRVEVIEELQSAKAAARSTWTTAGRDRLVKVCPGVGHDRNMLPDFHQATGKGAPQWYVKAPVTGRVVAVVREYPGGRYRPYDGI